MRIIKDLSDSLRENISEARHHIDCAYDLRESNRQAADWYRDMAVSHLNFNTAGHAAVKKLIDDHRSDKSPLAPGMLTVYESIHADLLRQTADVRSLIDQYAK